LFIGHFIAYTILMSETYRSLFDLGGRGAIVTGGAGIIGTEVCRALAAHGAHVAIVDLDASAAAEAADNLRDSYGVKTTGIACDVADPDAVADMVDRAVADIGDIHVLHNNAASKSDDLDAFFAPYEAYSLEEWHKIMRVNVDGMFLVSQAVGRRMIEQGEGGSIVQTASVYGIRGPDARIYEGSKYLDREINTPAVYSTSKGAVISLTRYLATTWAEHRIRVNTITPGGVESGQNETFKKKYGRRVPLGRMARRKEIVGAVVYLASEAASYVTGHNLVVDGGLSAW
jgi:NAD(P)-dependent dehydrogenase (short-subunit alcohol dehydrogenase family)